MFEVSRIFGSFHWPFGVRTVLEMILVHTVSFTLNMSPFRAIWIHFRQASSDFERIALVLGHSVMRLFLQGSCRPTDPLLFQGRLQPPVPPCSRMRCSASLTLLFRRPTFENHFSACRKNHQGLLGELVRILMHALVCMLMYLLFDVVRRPSLLL